MASTIDKEMTISAKITNTMMVTLPRYGVMVICGVLCLAGIVTSNLWLFLIFGALVALGFYNLTQKKHSILRNYPLGGYVRFLFEHIRPEIRQYFIEGDTEEVPFSRQERALVYQRAKNVSDTNAFGSLNQYNAEGTEWFLHSNTSHKLKDPFFRITVGGEKCLHPYSMSVFNISAMSFGALSANAVEALNKGAKAGHFAHDTGEGSISPYHLKHGGDLIWELGTGYFGCRTEDGRFNPESFRKKAALEQVKMIEIKISQGAKPGKGGVLPAAKITPEIATTREIPMDKDCISPATHSAFTTPRELVAFYQQLRELSGGKPVGFKLCIGQPWEFMAIVKAMIEADDYPDFIVVDGAEGGTGAAPIEFMDHVGMPLHDGFLIVQNTLVGAGIRDKIKIGVSGKIVTAFGVARALAMGADWVNSARGFMFSLGCLQSRACHTNKCPTGVATQDASRMKALVVEEKWQRVKNFHDNTLKALANIVGAVGVEHTDNLEPFHIARREPTGRIRLLSEHYYFIGEGQLLDDSASSAIFKKMWKMASPASFQPKYDPKDRLFHTTHGPHNKSENVNQNESIRT